MSKAGQRVYIHSVYSQVVVGVANVHVDAVYHYVVLLKGKDGGACWSKVRLEKAYIIPIYACFGMCSVRKHEDRVRRTGYYTWQKNTPFRVQMFFALLVLINRKVYISAIFREPETDFLVFYYSFSRKPCRNSRNRSFFGNRPFR